jgi:hypothetical protein
MFPRCQTDLLPVSSIPSPLYSTPANINALWSSLARFWCRRSHKTRYGMSAYLG